MTCLAFLEVKRKNTIYKGSCLPAQGGGIISLVPGPLLTWGQVGVAGGRLLKATGLGHSLGGV